MKAVTNGTDFMSIPTVEHCCSLQ